MTKAHISWPTVTSRLGKADAPFKSSSNSLDTRSKAKIARTLDLLEEFGIKLGMPYAKHEDLRAARDRRAEFLTRRRRP